MYYLKEFGEKIVIILKLKMKKVKMFIYFIKMISVMWRFLF